MRSLFENFSDEKFRNENFSDEKFRNENFSDEKFRNENFSDEKARNEIFSDEKSRNKKFSNEKTNSEGSNIDYSHHSRIKDFHLAISGDIRDDMVCDVNNSECFSLMFDESIDVSVSQNLIMYIRYLSVDKLNQLHHSLPFGLFTLQMLNLSLMKFLMCYVISKFRWIN